VGRIAGVGRHAPELWATVQPLYEAGDYADAADRGRELLDAYPDNGMLLYNVACAESRAGRAADALEHLTRAAELWDGVRAMASGDSDVDPIRNEPAFRELTRD
jgi:tetratricopeptide (TPR) repeat protein